MGSFMDSLFHLKQMLPEKKHFNNQAARKCQNHDMLHMPEQSG